MKRYHNYSITIVILVTLFVLVDIINFLHAFPATINAYPILPFNTYPSYIRGTNRLCHVMEGILEMDEYSDECVRINDWVKHSPELDSLCIYSVTQYAWKKDSLLMEVSLEDNSKRWLLASPVSSKMHKRKRQVMGLSSTLYIIEKPSNAYTCKLQVVETPSRKRLFSYCNVKLEDNTLGKILRHLDVHVALLIGYTLFALYLAMIISIIVLNIMCIVLLKRHFEEISSAEGVGLQILYTLAPLLPTVVWISLRIMTYIIT